MTNKQRIERHQQIMEGLMIDLQAKQQELQELLNSSIQSRLKKVMIEEAGAEIRYLRGSIQFNQSEIERMTTKGGKR